MEKLQKPYQQNEFKLFQLEKVHFIIIYLKKTTDNRGKPYQRCDSSLEIAQNNHDVIILLAIKKFFGGGYIKPKYNISNIIECKNSRSVNRYIFRDTKAIINFVDNYPMLNRKHLDYLD